MCGNTLLCDIDMKKHTRQRIQSLFTKFALLIVSLGILWLILARDISDFSLMVFRFDGGLSNVPRRSLKLSEQTHPSGITSLNTFPVKENSRPKKIIIVAYPRELLKNDKIDFFNNF